MSLRDFLMSPEASMAKAAEVKMRTQQPDVAVMVEGASDWFVYSKWLRIPPGRKFLSDKEALQGLQGRDKVYKLVEHCQTVGRPYLAVVDADDDCSQRRSSEVEGVIYTDFRDLEATMFLSGRADEALESMFQGKLSQQASRCQLTPAEYVLKQCAFTGAARMLRVRWQASIFYPPALVAEATRPATYLLDRDAYVSKLAAANRKLGFSEQDYLATAEEIYAKFEEEGDLGLLLHGHDVLRFLSRCSYRKETGEPRHSEDSVAAMLRLCFGLNEAQTTRMWSDIKRWSDQYQVDLLVAES